MFGKSILVFGAFVLAALDANAQAIGSVAPVSAARPLGAAASPPPAQRPSERLVLTGIVGFGSYKRAFLSIERPGQPTDLYTLQESREAGGVKTLVIDVPRSRVILQHRGYVHELTVARGGETASVVPSEKEQDIAHARHHTERARLDRENDERLAAQGGS